MVGVSDPGALSPVEARALFRGGHVATTAGWCTGHTQANMIAVPADWAYDVLVFCQRNPKPCPVLDITDAGSSSTALAPGADLRTDLPAYRVWRDGELVDEPADVTDVWRDDMVAFLLGCSFTFEFDLVRAGIPMRHVEQDREISMFVTNVACRPAGRVAGPMVVSMRHIPGERVEEAVRLSGRMPSVHGAPVHVGDPAGIGIADLAAPDFGGTPRPEPGDVPVFWACGVTPQAAVMASKPPFAITHAPGFMFVSDVADADYRIP